LKVLHYHESTKHHFNRFAASLGYLDWANQPDPFRRYSGAPLIELSRQPVAAAVPYIALYDGAVDPAPLDEPAIGEFLRCSMGLSAWKQFGASRWALRINPSSGNLHPTEAWVVRDGQVGHYAPREHALELRAALDAAAWAAFGAGRRGMLVALTSIHWREAWKYGERAFRYCQHDAGHAIGALRLAAALLGWNMALLPRWSTAQLSVLLGLDRDVDMEPAEREEPECLAIVTPDDPGPWLEADPVPLVNAARDAVFQGSPNRLSASHVDWPSIDDVAHATRYPGVPFGHGSNASAVGSRPSVRPLSDVGARSPGPGARQVMLQRRSAVAFDGQSSLPRQTFLAMLRRLQPGAPPWDAIDWPPLVHLALFVHRVDGLVPGVYAWLRDAAVAGEWRTVMRSEFLWEPAADDPNLFFLLPFDMTWPANRVSCDQDIAGDGFFSLGMIARFEPTLREGGEWMYRRLFWECGLIGQVLYLEAEAAGARATGIGCYYDDPVHEMLGLGGNTWQSLYHFSMGQPVDDPRITNEPGYPWEPR
jgi:SagB-type dehydrogenase family enzyme